MPYVSADGTVVEKRSYLRLSIVTDFIWTILNTAELFVRTLINPKAPIRKKKDPQSDVVKKPSYGRGNGPNIKSLPKDCPKGG